MRYVVLALVALVLAVTTGAAQEKDKKGKDKEAAKELKSRTKVKGKLVKVDLKKKLLVVQTAEGEVTVPVKGKLQLRQGRDDLPTQAGEKGAPVKPMTLEAARKLVNREVMIASRAGGMIISVGRK
jgi:hypothetical protein